jgi:two-component system sensor histidine kinase KdpD
MPRTERIPGEVDRAAPLRTWLLWFGALTTLTFAMVAARASLDKAHVALLFLLVVLGASSAGGRALGFSISAAAFLCFNFFFLPPLGTLTVAHPLDLLVLATFLVTSVVAAQLLYRANREAREARNRAAEIDRLAALGAETLNAADARDGLRAIVGVIQSILGVEYCEVIEHPEPAGEDDGRDSLHALLLPLRVRDDTVGVLRIEDARGLGLTPERRRLLDALAYYAALGVERVRLTEAAERAEAHRRMESLRSALLTSVSHDLRTPLTSIKGIAHEIANGGDPRTAGDIEVAADRLNALIGDMLELSRIQAGAVRPVVAVETIDDLVGAALQQARSVLKDRLVAIDGTEEMLSGRFAFTDALRVLVNLLENAAKYSPAESPIDLRIRREGTLITLSVMDRGSGVPESERERIFEPFYRPHGTPADTGGTGLGLSIARGLAEAQGGTVRFEPRDDGGAVFIFEMPAAEAPADAFNSQNAGHAFRA